MYRPLNVIEFGEILDVPLRQAMPIPLIFNVYSLIHMWNQTQKSEFF